MMLNFSWIAYTKKQEEAQLYFNELGQGKMRIFECKTTDTRYILADLDDRIIIAFRGTSTQDKIMTDLKVSLTSLAEYLPTSGTSFHRSDVLQKPKSAQYLSRAKTSPWLRTCVQSCGRLIIGKGWKDVGG